MESRKLFDDFVGPTEIAAMNAHYDELERLGVELLPMQTDMEQIFYFIRCEIRIIHGSNSNAEIANAKKPGRLTGLPYFVLITSIQTVLFCASLNDISSAFKTLPLIIVPITTFSSSPVGSRVTLG